MIRLSYNHAKMLLVLLASVSNAGEDELQEMRRQAARVVPELGYYAEDAIYADDIKGMLNLLVQQVTQPEDGSEGMLLDEIIRVLQSTHGRGALSKNTLNLLQQATLTQGEMSSLAAKLRERRMACCQCGVELERGELLVCSYLEGEDHAVRCLRCALPATVRCSFASPRSGARCAHTVPISKKLGAAIANIRHYCAQHEDGKEKEGEGSEAPRPDVNMGAGLLGRAFTQGPITFTHADAGIQEAAPPPNWRIRERIRNIEEDLRRRGMQVTATQTPAAEEDFDDLLEEGAEELL